MNKIIILAVLSILLPGCEGEPSTNSSVQQSPEMDVIAADTIKAGYPGVAIALIKPGGDILSTAAGYADRSTMEKMKPDDKLHAASTTKAFTATAALILVDRKQLALDTKLPQLLPQQVIKNIPYAEDIELHQLLQHTSGLYSPNNNQNYLARYIGPERNEKPFWTASEIVAFAESPENPPEGKPGSGSYYSDINYVLLSMIVSYVSGEPYKQFVQREIFDRLGLTDSYFLSDQPKQNRAHGYTIDSELLRNFGLDPALKADASGLIDTTQAQEKSDGAAGIITTVVDLAKFAYALTQGDLISESNRALIMSVAEQARQSEEGEARGILRGYQFPYGLVVTAEGDGPGINIVWVMQMSSKHIVVAAINQFGGWNESDYLLKTIVPAVLNIAEG